MPAREYHETARPGYLVDIDSHSIGWLTMEIRRSPVPVRLLTQHAGPKLRQFTTIRVYPGGAMILHYATGDHVGPPPLGLVPVER